MLSTVPRFPLRRCSEKATGNLKNYRPHRKLIYSQLRPKVRVAAARGSLAFSVPAMNSPRQTLPGFFFDNHSGRPVKTGRQEGHEKRPSLSAQPIRCAYLPNQKLQFALYLRLSYRHTRDCSPPITVPPEGTRGGPHPRWASSPSHACPSFECRDHALHCVRMSQTSNSPEAREIWSDLAKTWLRFASDLEANEGLLDQWDKPKPRGTQTV